MGNLRSAEKQFNDAEKSYQQALEHDPKSAEALSGLMNTYLVQKQTDKAVAAANTQIAKVPDSSAFYDLLGTVLLDGKKDLNGAEAALKKAAELDKNNGDALAKLGRVQVEKGSVDEAIATYQKSVQDNPNESIFYILMGELYESKQDWEKAKQSYQKALDLKPDNPVASNNLAYVMLETGGNVDVALSLAQTARRGLPDSPNAADTLGWVFYQKGAYKSAIDLFEEALRLAEKNKATDDATLATLHYHLGLAYDKTGDSQLARQHLERVLKISPNYSSAADVKKNALAVARLTPIQFAASLSVAEAGRNRSFSRVSVRTPPGLPIGPQGHLSEPAKHLYQRRGRNPGRVPILRRTVHNNMSWPGNRDLLALRCSALLNRTRYILNKQNSNL